MAQLPFVRDTLLAIHDLGGESDLHAIARYLEEDDPIVAIRLEALEENGKVERLCVLDEDDKFCFTNKGRRAMARTCRPSTGASSIFRNPKTGRPRLDWDKE